MSMFRTIISHNFHLQLSICVSVLVQPIGIPVSSIVISSRSNEATKNNTTILVYDLHEDCQNKEELQYQTNKFTNVKNILPIVSPRLPRILHRSALSICLRVCDDNNLYKLFY